MPKLTGTPQTVKSATGQRVTVSFYDDGSMRFRIRHDGPMAIAEAFLPGTRKEYVNIKVIPLTYAAP
jgi:hypothetical protein